MKELVHPLVTTLQGARPESWDRPELVAHAVLSGFAHHWPEHPLLSECGIPELLQKTGWLRKAEPGRWIKQRRMGLTKLARAQHR